MNNFILALAASANEPGILFTCLLGISVVFVGLVCIIGIVMLMNALCSEKGKAEKETPTPTPVATPAPAPATTAIANRQEIIAAVVAAVAEEEGTDISAIRVLSFKKL